MSFKAFKEFAQNAVTRCGASFEMKTVQKNFDGIVTAVKGYVFLFNEKQEMIPHEMLWNLKGQAMMIGEQFDLIKEVPFDEVEEEVPTLLEIEN
jgi:hypothetical protein